MATTIRSARAEFGGIYLRSLIETAELRLQSERARNHRLRAWRAARRLQELTEYEIYRHQPPGSHAPPPRTAFGVASAALACAVVAAIVTAAYSVDGAVPVVADVGMLALALIWFALSVACSRRRTPRAAADLQPQPESQPDAQLVEPSAERLPLWDWVGLRPPADVE